MSSIPWGALIVGALIGIFIIPLVLGFVGGKTAQ